MGASDAGDSAIMIKFFNEKYHTEETDSMAHFNLVTSEDTNIATLFGDTYEKDVWHTLRFEIVDEGDKVNCYVYFDGTLTETMVFLDMITSMEFETRFKFSNIQVDFDDVYIAY
jgi:hypothetical protein